MHDLSNTRDAAKEDGQRGEEWRERGAALVGCGSVRRELAELTQHGRVEDRRVAILVRVLAQRGHERRDL